MLEGTARRKKVKRKSSKGEGMVLANWKLKIITQKGRISSWRSKTKMELKKEKKTKY